MKLTSTFVATAFTVAATLAAPAEDLDYLVRFTFKGCKANTIMQISELALYDEAKNRLNLNLKEVAADTPVSELKSGEFIVSPTFGYGNNETWEKAFDGDSSTKLCTKFFDFAKGDQIAVTMRMSSEKLPIAYDFRTANDYLERTPNNWTVETSHDGGLTWVRVADSGFAAPTPANYYTWLSGGNNGDSSSSPFMFVSIAIEGEIPAQSYDADCPPTPIPTIRDCATGELIENVADFFDISYVYDIGRGSSLGVAAGRVVGKVGTKYEGNSALFEFIVFREGWDDYFVRFQIRASAYHGWMGDGAAMELSELAIYDNAKNRLNLDLKEVEVGTPTSGLKSGEFVISRKMDYYEGGTWDKAFDGDSSTKFITNNGLANRQSCEVTLCFSAPSVPAFYDFRTAGGGGIKDKSPTQWSVFSSLDGGVTWERIADDNGGSGDVFSYPNADVTWFGGRNDEDVSASPFPVYADAFSRLFMIAEPIPRQQLTGGHPCTPVPKVLDRTTGAEVEDVTGTFDITYTGNDKIGLASGTLTGKAGTKFEGQTLRFEFEVVSAGVPEYLVRFVFKDGDDRSRIQLSELAVYDTMTNRINLGLVDAGLVSAANLPRGAFALSREIGCKQTETPACLFDGAAATKLCADKNVGYNPSEPDTWLVLTMRFEPTSYPLAHYDLRTANDAPERSPKTWSVEVSKNGGRKWVEVDAQTNFAYPNSAFTWFSGKNEGDVSASPFIMKMPKSQGLALILR